jgi:hypothetical protein
MLEIKKKEAIQKLISIEETMIMFKLRSYLLLSNCIQAYLFPG